MSQPFLFLKAVVFDWAGTTVDHGSCAPAIVFQEIFRRQGIEISVEQAREPMGMAKREHIATITRMPDVSARWIAKFGREASAEDVDSMYEEFLPLQKETLSNHCDVISGIPVLVDECRNRGLKIGSSTGYTHELVDTFASKVATAGYSPDCVICSEDVPAGRPAPWMLFEAARQLDVYPMWSVVKVDDTGVGLAAARSAGSWAVGVTRTGNGVGLNEDEVAELSDGDLRKRVALAGERLTESGAHFLVESVADLMPLLEDIDGRLSNGERPAG